MKLSLPLLFVLGICSIGFFNFKDINAYIEAYNMNHLQKNLEDSLNFEVSEKSCATKFCEYIRLLKSKICPKKLIDNEMIQLFLKKGYKSGNSMILPNIKDKVRLFQKGKNFIGKMIEDSDESRKEMALSLYADRELKFVKMNTEMSFIFEKKIVCVFDMHATSKIYFQQNILEEDKKLIASINLTFDLIKLVKAGIVHADIKMENIVVDISYDTPRLIFIDFGGSGYFNMDNQFSITVPYVPPEYIFEANQMEKRKVKALNHSSDLWMTAMSMILLFFGESFLPFSFRTDEQRQNEYIKIMTDYENVKEFYKQTSKKISENLQCNDYKNWSDKKAKFLETLYSVFVPENRRPSVFKFFRELIDLYSDIFGDVEKNEFFKKGEIKEVLSSFKSIQKYYQDILTIPSGKVVMTEDDFTNKEILETETYSSSEKNQIRGVLIELCKLFSQNMVIIDGEIKSIKEIKLSTEELLKSSKICPNIEKEYRKSRLYLKKIDHVLDERLI